MRHGLVTVLAAAVCAVATGARSFVAVTEWIAGLPGEVAAGLGLAEQRLSESAIRRLVQRLDGDGFDTAIGAWVQRQCARVRPRGRRRARGGRPDPARCPHR